MTMYTYYMSIHYSLCAAFCAATLSCEFYGMYSLTREFPEVERGALHLMPSRRPPLSSLAITKPRSHAQSTAYAQFHT